MTQHRFTKGARDHACGVFTLLLTRMQEFERQHGVKPKAFLLHAPGLNAVREESYRRFGTFDTRGLAGVPFARCPCDKPLEPDWLLHPVSPLLHEIL